LSEISGKLLVWYDKYHRTLPWRIPPEDSKSGILPDPYHVWLSEIMLQQTTVTAVKPYYEKFLKLWPNITALAETSNESVMQAWAGLGYYSRARNLKKCAEYVVSELQGRFPDNETELIKLPGVGPYTAAAIASIAFQQPVAVVDGNIERVFARLFTINTPLPQAKVPIKEKVAKHLPAARPGDFAQGLMDLGSSICTPKKPNCLLCPLQDICKASKLGSQESYPVKTPKKVKPKRRGAAFVIEDMDGAIYLQKRPETGLLGGMSEVPTTDWNSNQDGETDIQSAPFSGDWQKRGEIRHVFTHFELSLIVYHIKVDIRPTLNGWWSAQNEIEGEALPNLMKKVVLKATDRKRK
jgi:A/G-specific adenine glycosylase